MYLSEFPFPKSKKSFKVSKKVEEKCREDFATLRPSGTANFIHVFSTKKRVLETRFYSKQACHARNLAKYDNIEAVMTEMCSWKRRKRDKEIYKGFTKWLVKESFFSRFISNRSESVDTILDTGLILSSDIPQPILHAICIISRHIYECEAAAFKKFDLYVSQGLTKEAAYILCFNSNISTTDATDDVSLSYPLTCKQAGHRAWYLLNLPNLKRFVTEGPNLPNSVETFRQLQSTGNVKNLFRQEPGDTFVHSLMSKKDFKDLLSSYRKNVTSGEGYVPPNPFVVNTRPIARPFQISLKEADAVVVPYLISIGL